MLAFGLGIAGVIGGIVRFGPVVAEWVGGLFDARTEVEKLTESLQGLTDAQLAVIKTTQAANAFLFPEEARFARRAAQQEAIEAERRAVVGAAVRARAQAGAAVRLRTRSGSTIREVDAAASAEFHRVLQEANETRNRQNAALAETVKLEEAQLFLREQALEKARDAAAAAALRGPQGKGSRGGGFISAGTAPGQLGGDFSIGAGGQFAGGLGGLAGGTGLGTFGQFGDAGGLGLQVPGVVIPPPSELELLVKGMTEFGTATEQVAEHAFAMRDGFLEAFEAIGSGQKSVTDALIDFARQGVAGALRAEAEKQFALGVADAILLNPQAVLHFAAAASLATAAGAIGGGGSAGSGSRGGGSLPGAAAGALGGGGNDQTREVVYIGLDSFDDDVRGKRRRLRGMQDRAEAELGPGSQIRRE
jgi:hypothetical protein